jgi:long-chain acyl-CoA synthetase
MSDTFQCPVANYYGTTESTPKIPPILLTFQAPGVCANGVLRFGLEVKLRDVPEMNYTSADKPHPRGEIYIKSPTMTPGYYNNEARTKDSFVDGYFMSGDIGELDEEGKLHVIDRIKNM